MDNASEIPVECGPIELLHDLLKKVIDEHFGCLDNMPDPVRHFIGSVNIAFWQADADKLLMERAYELSSRKLIFANDKLRSAHSELERKVWERTEELLRTNNDLTKEIIDRRRAEKTLREREKDLHQLTVKLRGLASELSLAEERERRRIASELHDSVVQTLVFSKFSLENIMAHAPADISEPLHEVHFHVKRSIQDLRSLTIDISPPILYELGLEQAVVSLSCQMQMRHGVMFSFNDDGGDKPLHNNLKVLIYQAVRELLLNIVKHAKAKNGSISLTREGKKIRVEVEDDGVGFNTFETAQDNGKKDCFGLFNIRERLSHFQGAIEIDSRPGKGTRVILTAPLGGS
ncbi:MAG TPA: sensor histidine kinase [Dissulfurispiraceae bacterium]|nr:sensor histidine kinase [Dissulfurispiraceae bacterium]